MTPSMTPILLGEDYQHLYFWIQAARLFMEDDPAEVVYVEHPIIQAFDDVAAVNRVPLYGYDRFGNLTSASDNTSATSTYAYDEANRLTTIAPPTGGQVTFAVDPLDRHATRSVGGTPSDNYGYLGPTETAWSTGLAASPTTSLIDVDGTRLAIKTASTVSWLIFDLHGSIVALCTAGTTTLSDAYRYDGYGQLLASSGSATNPYHYRGRLNIGSDSLTWALADMGARDYSPQLGTFTQLDSVQGQAANPLSMNRFLYALANPATLVDPDGHAALEDETCKTCGYAVTSSTGNYTVVSHGTTTTHRRINGHDYTKVVRSAYPHNSCVGPCKRIDPVPPALRDNYRADVAAGNTWTPDPELIGPMILQAYLARCNGDVACQVTTAREAMASGDIDLAPDYVTVGGTAIVPILGPFGLGVNGGVTNTRSGHVYGFLGPAGGLAGANAEVRAGYIINCPDPCDADSFVTGWSVTGGGFAPVYPPGSPVGVGPAVSGTWGYPGTFEPSAFAIEVGGGIGTPSVGASVTYSGDLGIEGFHW